MIINQLVVVEPVKVKRSFMKAMHLHLIGIFLLSLILPMVIVLMNDRYVLPANAETGTLSAQTIDGDAGVNNFAENSGVSDGSCTGGTQCDYVDEDGEADYLGTGTGMDGTTAEEEFTTTNPVIDGTLTSIDEVRVIVRAGINGSCQGGGSPNCDGLDLRIYIDGAYNGTTNSTTNLTTSATDYTYTWSGLSEPTADDLQIEIIRSVVGGGSPTGRDDDVRIYDVRYEIDYTYIPDIKLSMLSQEGFVWENDDFRRGLDDYKQEFPSSVDASAWTNASDVLVDDSSYATYTIPDCGAGAAIKVSDFDINIPSYAQIDGIQVAFDRYKSGSGPNIGLFNIQLTKNDIAVGTGFSNSNPWPDSGDLPFARIGFQGSSSELWGTTWTPADIAQIGVIFQPELLGAICNPTIANVDHIKINVYYSAPTIEPTVQSGSEFSSAVAMDNVRQGERLNLRMHLKNTGEGEIEIDDELALFYDRNDNNWSRVSNSASVTSAGSCISDTNFECEAVDATGSVGEHSSIAVHPHTGQPWISYYDGNLNVAYYVGSGGNCDSVGGGSDAWQCEIVDATDDIGQYSEMAFSDDGTAWIGYYDATNTSLELAHYVGSGGNCDSVGGGSDAWECETIHDDSFNNGANLDIAIDNSGNPIISFSNETSFVNYSAHVAEYAGSGGSCSNTAWDCTSLTGSTSAQPVFTSIDTDGKGDAWIAYSYNNFDYLRYVNNSSGSWSGGIIEGINSYGGYVDIAVGPDGAPIITSLDTSRDDMYAIEYVGSGGSGCASSAWNCEMIDGAIATANAYMDVGFNSSGQAMIVYANGVNVALATKVGGTGGTCLSAAWMCNDIQTSSRHPSLAFGPDGNTLISLYDTASQNLEIAVLNRASEITASSSQNYNKGDAISFSRSDMTSSSDTTNRNDADCISGSTTWNNGVYFGAEIGTGLTLPAGDSTAQCTEVMWTIDTSHAVAGATYRFVVATKDSFNPSKGIWRGPIQVDEYPTITIRDDFEQSTRYSKTTTPSWTGCDTYAAGSTGSADWSCQTIDGLTDAVGTYKDIVIDNNNTPWISYKNSTDGSLIVATYVGSGGDCASAAWECTTVLDHNTDTVGEHSSIAIDKSGVPWVSFQNVAQGSVYIARYVGSGGNCDELSNSTGSDEWQCELIDDRTDLVGGYSDLEFDLVGNPWISYWEGSGTTELVVANYVGSGGNCDTYAAGSTGSDAWQCTVVDAQTNGTGRWSDLFIDSIGRKWVAYETESPTNNLTVAQFVGSGGNCDTYAAGSTGSDAWQCTVVDDQTDDLAQNDTTITEDSNGDIWVSYANVTDGALVAAQFVGSGGNCDTYAAGSTGSDAWQCTVVDDQSDGVGGWPAIAFDHSGIPWITHENWSDNAVVVSKLNLPSNPLGFFRGGNSIPSGDYSYLLTAGRSPYNSTGLNCAGNPLLAGYCGLDSDNGSYDSLFASSPFESPLYGMATKYQSNSTIPSITWSGKTNLAPSTSGTTGDIVIEAYRFGSTNGWEEIARDSTSSDCSTENCVIRAIPSGTASEYYETINGDYWMYVRIYQVIDGATTINFNVDSFKASSNTSQLGTGGFFRDGVELPLNLQL